MTVEETLLLQRYQQIQDLVNQYAEKYQRSRDSISLIAVSKRHLKEKIIILLAKMQMDFAENYLQEGTEKIEHISKYCTENNFDRFPCWHFIGHIQSKKSKMIARKFDWVHTLESAKVANKLDQHRQGFKPLNVLIQLNLQQEESKSGIGISETEELACHIQTLPNLNLRGLMIIPKPEKNFEKQCAIFRKCREHLEHLNAKGHRLDQLSMGMTSDMEAAIAEGATQVRIGTAIFGQRLL